MLSVAKHLSDHFSPHVRLRERGILLLHFSIHRNLLEVFLARHSVLSPALKKRAAKIQVLLMDVDGTLTDGGVTLLSQTDGTALEIKTFDAHDGQGLTLANTAGVRTGVISGRESPSLVRRAREMKIEFVYQKQPQKIPAYEEILKKAGVPETAVAYVGDDLPICP